MNKLSLQICSWNKTRYLVGRQPNVTPKEKEKQTKSKVTTRKKNHKDQSKNQPRAMKLLQATLCQ